MEYAQIAIPIKCQCLLSTQNGVSALMIAAEMGHVFVMDTLLQYGASMDMNMTVSAQLTES